MSKAVGFKISLHTAQGQFEEIVQGVEICVGRNVSADLPIMANGVSRSHLVISQKKGKIKIKDLGSTNGTYIKGEAVAPHKDLDYEPGTRVSLGQAGCFIRIETLENKGDQKTESLPNPAPAPTETQIKSSSQETNILYFLGRKTNKKKGVSKNQQKVSQYMESAEKLVRKKVSEAEDSMRKGVEKARENARKILLDAKREADILSAKAELNRAGLEKEILSLNGKKEKLEESYLKFKKENSQQTKEKERELGEIESKLSGLSEAHKNKVSALNTEISFLKSEGKKKKSELLNLVEKIEALEKESADKIERLSKNSRGLDVKVKAKGEELSSLEEKKKALEFEASKFEKRILAQAEKEKELSEKVVGLKQSLKLVENEKKEIFREAREKASTIEKNALELKKDAVIEKKEMLKNAKLKAKEILETSAKKQIKLMDAARLEKIEFLKEAKDLKTSAKKDYDLKMKEFLDFEKSEKLKVKNEVSALKEKNWEKLEKEIAAEKILRLKKIDSEVSEERRLVRTYKDEYAESWGLAISIAVEQSLKEGGREVLRDSQAFREKVHQISKSIIKGNREGEESKVQELMFFNPSQREGVRKFWKKAASSVFLLLVVVFGGSPFLKVMRSETKSLAEKSSAASEKRVADFQEEVKELKLFKPVKRTEFFPTYTERVLYTVKYVENELSESYREDWFLSLDTFFVEELLLPDEAIVTFISKETNLLKKLAKMRDGINAQFAEKGIEQMKVEELGFVNEVKSLLESKEKLESFRQFKLDYYMERFPFSDRSLASEKE